MEATGDIRSAIKEINDFVLDDKTLKVEAVKVNLKAEKSGYGPPSLGGPSDWSASAKYVNTQYGCTKRYYGLSIPRLKISILITKHWISRKSYLKFLLFLLIGLYDSSLA